MNISKKNAIIIIYMANNIIYNKGDVMLYHFYITYIFPPA